METIQKLLHSNKINKRERLEIKQFLKRIQKPKKKKKKAKKIKVKKDVLNRKIEYKKYLNSAKWKAIRQDVLLRDNYRCAYCYNLDNLHIHHLSYVNFKKEKLSDLITLCKDCHKGEHLSN
jgi:5-methylcytosine-specific restriction endonuclease McrA